MICIWNLFKMYTALGLSKELNCSSSAIKKILPWRVSSAIELLPIGLTLFWADSLSSPKQEAEFSENNNKVVYKSVSF